jgi:hypothetical protein
MVRFAPIDKPVRFGPAALRIGSGWYLRVTFPNGERTQAPDFLFEQEAKLSIEEESEAWLAAYRRNRRGGPTVGGEGD